MSVKPTSGSDQTYFRSKWNTDQIANLLLQGARVEYDPGGVVDVKTKSFSRGAMLIHGRSERGY